VESVETGRTGPQARGLERTQWTGTATFFFTKVRVASSNPVFRSKKLEPELGKC
jgi:hypothetical protein